jgi:23S rRNA (pseudouridine1915-N3)-methyltransferase
VRVRVIAVGTRMPQWVRSACDDYLTRLAPQLNVALVEIEPGARPAGTRAGKARGSEGERLLGSLRATEQVIALDERGAQLTTREFSAWLQACMHSGEDLAFLIGGADGLVPEVLSRSNFTLALSRLTLPHAFARVLLVEQLYRAVSILTQHPYHRD